MQGALLVLDDHHALAGEDEEFLLDRLRVIAAVGFPGCMTWMFTPRSGHGANHRAPRNTIMVARREWLSAGASATLMMSGLSTGGPYRSGARRYEPTWPA